MDEELLDRIRAIGREVNKSAQRAKGSCTLCTCQGVDHSKEDHYCGICGLPLHYCSSIAHYGLAMKYRVVNTSEHKLLEYDYENLIKRITEEREHGGKRSFGFLRKDTFFTDLEYIIEKEDNFSIGYRSGEMVGVVCTCKGIEHSKEDHYCGKCGLPLYYKHEVGGYNEAVHYSVVNAIDRQLLEYKWVKLTERIREEKAKLGIIAYLDKGSFLSDLEAIIALKKIPFLKRMLDDRWCPD